jgi:hypothetical protein
VFEAVVHDLRAVLRLAQGRKAEPSAVIFDSRILQSTPESGTRAGYDGAKRRRGSKVHMDGGRYAGPFEGEKPMATIKHSRDQHSKACNISISCF